MRIFIQSFFKILPLRVVNPPTMAIIRSVAVSSTTSPSCSLTRGSLLNRETVTSCEISQVEAAVCSLMKGVAILKSEILDYREVFRLGYICGYLLRSKRYENRRKLGI